MFSRIQHRSGVLPPARSRLAGRFGALLALCALLGTAPGVARESEHPPRVHTVYAGQRLGSIAKRYHVSVAAIRNANALGRADRIRAGQRLLIPSPSDKDGSQARELSLPDAQTTNLTSLRRDRDKGRDDESDDNEAEAEPPRRTHRVYAGQRLGSIARRYHVTLEALRAANGLQRRDRLIPGQVLTIPEPGEDLQAGSPGSRAGKRADRRKSWRDPAARGEIVLFTYSEHFRGRALDRKGHVLPATARQVSMLLGASGSRPRIDTRLVRLLSKVSDRFGGRPIRVVSGFRTRSFYEDSRHRLSRAVDFSIPGVANSVLRDYLRTLRNVGVGYYPNSSFVHLDVREATTYWVDYAGPGEAPKSSAHGAPRDAEADADLRDPEVELGDRGDHVETNSSARAPDSDDAEPGALPGEAAPESQPPAAAAPAPKDTNGAAPDRPSP